MTRFAYVGSRTTRERHARGEGITVFRVDEASAALERVQIVGDLVNPSFLVLNRRGDRLYVDRRLQTSGRVYAKPLARRPMR